MLSAARPPKERVERHCEDLRAATGLSCSGEVWDETVMALEGRHEVHVLSLAGFAGRAAIEAPFLPRVRDDIVAYIQAHQLDRPAIIGHSLGGFLAFWLAASEPTLIGPIVAVDGVPFLPALMDAGATADSVRTMTANMKAIMASLTPSSSAYRTGCPSRGWSQRARIWRDFRGKVPRPTGQPLRRRCSS